MPGPGGGLGPRGFLTEEEKANVPKLTKGLVRRILSYLKPYKWQFLLVFVTIVVSAIVGLLPSIITGRIVDDALVGRDMVLLIQLLIFALIALTASQLIGMLESYINAWISQKIIFDMKNQMYKHLEYMPHAFFTTEKQGDIITRMNTDISDVSSVISGTLSSEYQVRLITEAEVSDVYHLYRSNRRYYRHAGVKWYLQELTDLMEELPDNISDNSGAVSDPEIVTEDKTVSGISRTSASTRKYFIGFYDEGGSLTAVLDLITGEPERHDAFIGWFMIKAELQRRGIGSQLFADIRSPFFQVAPVPYLCYNVLHEKKRCRINC